MDFPGVIGLDQLDIDPNFEPQTRARSNTWPLPRPDNFIDQDEGEKQTGVPVQHHGQIPADLAGQVPKKNSSRRNAWGNMSYADLITQAIQSSPDKRLTLAQIYEWMVQNVAYFKDKGDSNSSAGWKNSIRHNLSLHNRFMRVQNEGTGKSSWWMINPDAKPGKAARRRATSMETQKYEKKRGRVKKKVEALRNGGLPSTTATTPSPSSSISEGQDMFPESPVHHGFQLSPDSFRPRASSNASSCSRLSPIPAVETDMHDSEVPPLSPIPWNSEMTNLYDPPPPAAVTASAGNGIERYSTEHLVETLAESMKLRNNGTTDSGYRLPECALKSITNGCTSQQQQQSLNTSGTFGPIGGYNHHYNGRVGTNGDYSRPPRYQAQSLQQHSPDSVSMTTLGATLQKRKSPQQVIETAMNGGSYTLTRLQTVSSTQSLSPNRSLEPVGQSNTYQRPPSINYMDSVDPLLRGQMGYKEIKEPMSSPLLTQQQTRQVPPPSYHHQQQNQTSSGTSLSSTANQVVGHLLYNSLPQDLDFDSLQGGLECDVDQVIRHELSVDGNLDFNFDPMSVSTNSSVPRHPTTMTTTRSWVH